mmetsp:Transcript_4848/g.7199  ORF Transcript_4848/g.7199 Transcript_4848/m.7199 type:complete len:86 (+) Transcript_4848:508-765(+)|eukprot:CAMPEP_0167764748 /NCGR_PEP_ID=MMETSP0110_2-20121227/14236_1 /TAXON_ID=629695 /ORGANISM="Gymnochlora sp., Strain CCMP2014" /LENGTH=85 /DNA_ID=CAMNT_0007652249 /DNA_START=175 /DNA_END=432 /DNA_ORIENTATION=-
MNGLNNTEGSTTTGFSNRRYGRREGKERLRERSFNNTRTAPPQVPAVRGMGGGGGGIVNGRTTTPSMSVAQVQKNFQKLLDEESE